MKKEIAHVEKNSVICMIWIYCPNNQNAYLYIWYL